MPSEGFIACHHQTRFVAPVWRLGLGCSTGTQAMPNLADRPLKRTWEEMGPCAVLFSLETCCVAAVLYLYFAAVHHLLSQLIYADMFLAAST